VSPAVFLKVGKLLNLFLWPFLLLLLPLVLLLFPRARPHLRERFGLGAAKASKNARSILFHLASLGEANAATPLIRALHGDGVPLILSATSESGRGALVKAFPDTPVSLLPLDLPGLWDPFWSSRRVSRVILFETEIWPMMLLTAYSRKIPVMVVNGRLSPAGFSAMKRWRFFLKPLFSGLSRVLVSSFEDRERYLEMGVTEDVLVVTGNIKWDMSLPESTPEALREDLSGWILRFEEACSRLPGEEERVDPSVGSSPEKAYLRVVLGSAHPGETLRIVEALIKDPDFSSRLHLLVAPRHLERLPELLREGSALSRVNLQFRSRIKENRFPSFQNGPIVSILDTHGELRTLYSLSHLAITGGTFDPVGGHSPVEAASCAIPQVAGPFTEHVSSLIDRLVKGGGLFLEKDEASLVSRLRWFWEHPLEREKRGEMAFKVFLSEQGALSRTLALLREFMKEDPGSGGERS
jgi:3-deoxy-D-manno-octulosonic-acid transferase